MEKPLLSTAVRQLPKVGLVLGTGGIKAMAGLALFEFLQEQKIPIDLQVGCSGGALACAAIGMGYSPTEVRDMGMERLQKHLFTQLNYSAIMAIFSSKLGTFNKSSGIVKPDRWREALGTLFGDRKIEQLRPRTLIQTTDVDTGEGVVLTKGSVAEAVYASCAFFPAFPPARIDGRNLGDGIYSAPVPVMEAIKRNMDVIIALDFKEKVRTEPNGFFSCFYRHIDNTMRTLTRSQMFLSIELHHHEIVIVEVDFDHSINPWDVHELPAIVDAGRVSIEKHKEMILSAIKGFAQKKEQRLQRQQAEQAAAGSVPAQEPLMAEKKEEIKPPVPPAGAAIRQTVLLRKPGEESTE
jgi:NTE family protein